MLNIFFIILGIIYFNHTYSLIQKLSKWHGMSGFFFISPEFWGIFIGPILVMIGLYRLIFDILESKSKNKFKIKLIKKLLSLLILILIILLLIYFYNFKLGFKGIGFNIICGLLLVKGFYDIFNLKNIIKKEIQKENIIKNKENENNYYEI